MDGGFQPLLPSYRLSISLQLRFVPATAVAWPPTAVGCLQHYRFLQALLHVPTQVLEKTGDLPDYVKQHPIYYAGPAKTPCGMPSGSFGPTTAGRMDSYVQRFQAAGGSMVMLAKGNRSASVREACAQYGGFYLGSIGGVAAKLALESIKKVEVLEYPELGMEAVHRCAPPASPFIIPSPRRLEA